MLYRYMVYVYHIYTHKMSICHHESVCCDSEMEHFSSLSHFLKMIYVLTFRELLMPVNPFVTDRFLFFRNRVLKRWGKKAPMNRCGFRTPKSGYSHVQLTLIIPRMRVSYHISRRMHYMSSFLTGMERFNTMGKRVSFTVQLVRSKFSIPMTSPRSYR